MTVEGLGIFSYNRHSLPLSSEGSLACVQLKKLFWKLISTLFTYMNQVSVLKRGYI